MRKQEFWKLSIWNILSSPLRSFLTVLGMAIGVGAILAVLTLGDAGKLQVRSEMSRLGIDKVRMTTNHLPLTEQDGKLLAMSMKTSVSTALYWSGKATTSYKSVSAQALGCQADQFRSLSPVMIDGRQLLPLEWSGNSRSTLVGEVIARMLGLRPGEWFSFDGIMLRCVGIMGSSQDASQVDTAQTIVIPQQVLQRKLGKDIVHELTIAVPAGMSPDETAAKAVEVLRSEAGKETTAVSLQVQAEAANSILTIFIDVLRWVAVICMFVGGIGVMNILIVSVRERRREIGIMQSLGADAWQICSLFLCEALIYALIGGSFGLLLGGVLIRVAGESIGLAASVRFSECIIVFFCAIAVGLASGVVPAIKACTLQPVEALVDP